LSKAAELVRYQADHGSDQQVLSADETLRVEPSLRGMAGLIAGSIYTPGEETGDCRRFTQAVFQRLVGTTKAAVHLNTRVVGLRRERGRIVAALTGNGGIQ